ncbi:MAG: tRNA pseudouridine(38-40) synthase TruA [Verrucomicrobiia bacterium]
MNEQQEHLKFRLTIAYDGTNYEGWQVQKVGLGVQQKVEEAIQVIFPSVRRIHSSSRTDAGVHARGMVAHVEIPKAEFRMPIRKLSLALNANLPEDIRITRAVRSPARFHARFDAKGKQYRYQVWNHRVMNPLLRQVAWHVARDLDIAAIREAAKCFMGRRDYRSLANSREYEMETTVRTLFRCDVRKSSDLLTFVIEGDGFLYKMCRNIVGMLVQVGQGKLSAGDIETSLAACDRKAAGVAAPAKGLILWEVYYSPRKAASSK